MVGLQLSIFVSIIFSGSIGKKSDLSLRPPFHCMNLKWMILFWFYQAAEQERSLFVSILLPLLSEYSLHPQISDSQSIVSSVKVRIKILSFLSFLVYLF